MKLDDNVILNISLDIVEKTRINKVYLRYRMKFLDRILHKMEFNLVAGKKNHSEFISRVFAVKEAVLKSFGTGIRHGMTFRKINILNNYLGRPLIKKHQRIKFILTISHEKSLLVAMIIVVKF